MAFDGRACACTEAEIPHRSLGRRVMDLEGKRTDSDTCQAAALAGAGGIERFQGDMIARRKREPSARKSVTATPGIDVHSRRQSSPEGTGYTGGRVQLGPPEDSVPSKKGRTCKMRVCFFYAFTNKKTGF